MTQLKKIKTSGIDFAQFDIEDLNREADKVVGSSPLISELNYPMAGKPKEINSIFNVNRMVTDDLERVAKWKDVVEEPSISGDSEEEDESDDEDSDMSKTDQQKLAANLLSSDDETQQQRPKPNQNKKVFRAQQTIEVLENLLKDREHQTVQQLRAPELTKQFDDSNEVSQDDLQKQAMNVNYVFVGLDT